MTKILSLQATDIYPCISIPIIVVIPSHRESFDTSFLNVRLEYRDLPTDQRS